MVRGPISLVIVSVISLFMFILVSGGPKVFENVLPESAVAWLTDFGMGNTMGSFGGSSFGNKPKDPNDASARLEDNHDGWQADDGVTTLAGMHLAFVDQVIDGYSRRVVDAVPGPVEVLEEQAGCAFTPPSEGAYVGLATVSERTPIGLATYNDSHIADAVQYLAKIYRLEGKVERATLQGLSFEVADIAVTETAKPVYLVLDASYRRIVYNIHLAPGATIERVVLIGGIEAGVANVAADVPVEVMTDEIATACGFQAFYPLNPGHLFFQSMASGAMSQEDVDLRLAQFKAAEVQWEKIFRASFGVSPDGLSTGSVGEVSLATIGPVPATPEARAVWKTVKDAPLRVTVDQYVERPGAGDGRDFDAVVKAVAKSFAWGKLENLSNGVNY
jgi:hypothetical protein